MEEHTSVPQGVASPAAPPHLLLARLLQRRLLRPCRRRHDLHGQDGDHERGVDDQAAIGVMEGRLRRKKVQLREQFIHTTSLDL